MNLFLVMGIVGLAGGAWVWAQTKGASTEGTDANANPNPNAPQITFEYEVWDFGDVPEGGKVSHDFYFTNTGKEPLIIHNVRASCGCTTPYWPRQPIPPGGRDKITVVYNTQGRPGPFHKVVTIYSNAATPVKQIVVKGRVVRQEMTGSPEESSPFDRQAQ